MHKTFVVAKHEFLSTVKTKGFIFSLILPFLIFIPMVLSIGIIPFAASEMPEVIGFVDESGILFASGDFVKYTDFDDAKGALIAGEIESLFTLRSDYLETGKVRVYSKTGPFNNAPTRAIETFLITGLLTESNLEEGIKKRIKEPLNAERIILKENGEVEEGGEVGIFLPYAVGFLLMIMIVTSSGYMMQGIVSEKENRTVEILLSSLSSGEILNGKILGYGSAGFLQVAIWICAGLVIISFTPLSSLLQVFEISGLLILTILYFILGYLLFASSMACVAAPASNMNEAQQGAGVFTMLAVLPLMLQGFVSTAPNSTIARVLSYLPYTAPVTMLMRLTQVNVPTYEIVASLSILAISVVVMMNLSARIFRTGILMYGKKFSFKDILSYLTD